MYNVAMKTDNGIKEIVSKFRAKRTYAATAEQLSTAFGGHRDVSRQHVHAWETGIGEPEYFSIVYLFMASTDADVKDFALDILRTMRPELWALDPNGSGINTDAPIVAA